MVGALGLYADEAYLFGVIFETCLVVTPMCSCIVDTFQSVAVNTKIREGSKIIQEVPQLFGVKLILAYVFL